MIPGARPLRMWTFLDQYIIPLNYNSLYKSFQLNHLLQLYFSICFRPKSFCKHSSVHDTTYSILRAIIVCGKQRTKE